MIRTTENKQNKQVNKPQAPLSKKKMGEGKIVQFREEPFENIKCWW